MVQLRRGVLRGAQIFQNPSLNDDLSSFHTEKPQTLGANH